jgi:hypothetical protein
MEQERRRGIERLRTMPDYLLADIGVPCDDVRQSAMRIAGFRVPGCTRSVSASLHAISGKFMILNGLMKNNCSLSRARRSSGSPEVRCVAGG